MLQTPNIKLVDHLAELLLLLHPILYDTSDAKGEIADVKVKEMRRSVTNSSEGTRVSGNIVTTDLSLQDKGEMLPTTIACKEPRRLTLTDEEGA